MASHKFAVYLRMGGGFTINSLGEIRCVARTPLFTMEKSVKSTSSKSSIISTKAVSVKKTIQKTAKAVVWPLKKLKKLKHLLSLGLTISHSSTVAVSNTKTNDSKQQSDADSESSHDSNSELDIELTLEQELGTLLSHYFVRQY